MRSRILTVALAVVCLALAGCGGGGEEPARTADPVAESWRGVCTVVDLHGAVIVEQSNSTPEDEGKVGAALEGLADGLNVGPGFPDEPMQAALTLRSTVLEERAHFTQYGSLSSMNLADAITVFRKEHCSS